MIGRKVMEIVLNKSANGSETNSVEAKKKKDEIDMKNVERYIRISSN
jgi:hypothetical protein